jgi:hypothetical protein
MERLQILNGACVPKVGENFSDAAVPRLGSFARCDVRQLDAVGLLGLAGPKQPLEAEEEHLPR